MKKLTFSILALFLFLTNATPVHAAPFDSRTVEVLSLEDGYQAVITTEIYESSQISRAASSKTASRTYTLKDSSGSAVASYKLTGNFTYNGVTSSCTSASYSTSVLNDDWTFTQASASRSDNKAIGSFTAKQIIFGVVRQTVSDTVTLTCDKNGNIY